MSSKNIHEQESKTIEENHEDNVQVIEAKAEKAKLIDWGEIKKFFIDAKSFMFAITPEEAKYQHKIEEELHQQIRPAVLFGGLVILITVGFFIVWSGLAPLDSAAMAEGSIVVSGNHKTIQHLEGGVIEQILVEDGQSVQAGQELIILNSTHAKSEANILLSQLRLVKSVEKRLVAEERGDDNIDFSDDVLDTHEQEVQQFIQTQTALFELNKKALRAALEVMDHRIVQFKEDLKSGEANLRSYNAQLLSVKEQLATAQKLFDQGLELKSRVILLQNRVQELEANVHTTKSAIAKCEEQIAESALNKIRTETEYRQKLAQEYKENRSAVLQSEQKYQAVLDVLSRRIIRAPSAGIITGLQYHTIGGVINPGGRVMDIVPQDDKLLVEAMIAPQDIESIRVGLEAKIQLNAYKNRLVPRIAGEVIYVSADRFTDEKSGRSHYIARIEIKEETVHRINSDIKLYPGMPVTVFIVKGTRTFLQYLISPILDSFHRAFKEA